MTPRRQILRGAVAAAIAPLAAFPGSAAMAEVEPEAPKPRNGRVKQSLAFWCFNARGPKWEVDKVCEVAKDLGCVSVELIGPEHWTTLKKHGLICAIAPNGMPAPPFMRGFNNADYHEELVDRTKNMIDEAAKGSCPNVIGFVGYKWRKPEDPKSGAISTDEAFDNCVKGLKSIAGHAEKKGVTLCIEHLNTRDDSDPMKGHPGYQGDDLDFVAAILRKVGSPRVKLLFDIYHVQLMHGDLIRRIEQTKDIIGHVHTAGVPGRGELDDLQEINYPAVIKKLVSVGYNGYVGQEYIPTREPIAGLQQAVRACDV